VPTPLGGRIAQAAHRPACVDVLDAVGELPVEMLGIRFDGRHDADPAKGGRVGRASVDRLDVEFAPVPAMAVDRDSRVVQRIEHKISSTSRLRPDPCPLRGPPTASSRRCGRERVTWSGWFPARRRGDGHLIRAGGGALTRGCGA
jgi:hypothetical protein